MNFTRHGQHFRDALVDEVIRAAFPSNLIPMVSAYDGKVDPKAIARHSVNPPAILVSILGGKTLVRGGSIYDNLAMAVFVVAKDQAADKRTAIALFIRERLSRLLPSFDFPVGSVFTSKHKFGGMDKSELAIDWQNRFDNELNELGLTMWIGAWHHAIELPALEDYASLDDFQTLYVEAFDPGEVEATPETGNALTEQEITLETL